MTFLGKGYSLSTGSSDRKLSAFYLPVVPLLEQSQGLGLSAEQQCSLSLQIGSSQWLVTADLRHVQSLRSLLIAASQGNNNPAVMFAVQQHLVSGSRSWTEHTRLISHRTPEKVQCRLQPSQHVDVSEHRLERINLSNNSLPVVRNFELQQPIWQMTLLTSSEQPNLTC